LILIGLSLLFSITMCVHAAKSGRELYWIFIILGLQPVGGLVYFVIAVLPELTGGSTARRLRATARDALDPMRAYREAKAACDDSPTVTNRMRLATAAAGLGRHDEAEALYREAAQGIHADDPTLMLGRAQALVELHRYEEALDLLEALGSHGEKGRTPQAAIAMGRAYQALGRLLEADDAYEWATQRLPGLEAWARYAVFLKETGRSDEAEAIMADLEKRLTKTRAHFRTEARQWRDFAAARLQNRA